MVKLLTEMNLLHLNCIGSISPRLALQNLVRVIWLATELRNIGLSKCDQQFFY
jgi:hypothetical protein